MGATHTRFLRGLIWNAADSNRVPLTAGGRGDNLGLNEAGELMDGECNESVN
jgi:hypothetical protein